MIFLRWIPVFLALIVLPCRAAMAGYDTGPSSDTWFGFFVETGVETSDNVFHLSKSEKDRLDEGDPDDQASARYAGMDSVEDTIVISRLGFNAGSGNPFGGRLNVSSWLQCNIYTENSDCSYPEARMRVSQSVGERGRASVVWKIINGFLSDNDLAAVDDANANGNIAKDERTYAPSVYDEVEGIVSYDHVFLKDKGSPVSKFAIEPFGGTARRIYDTPFGNRDRRSRILGLGIRAGFFSKLDLEIVYRYEDSSSPGNDELVLVDETGALGDINGDGEVKANAALVTAVDRSFHRHSVEISPSIELTDHVSLFAGYKWRTTSYTSDNDLDLDHYHASADRIQFKTGLECDFSRSWSGRIEYRHTDDDGEEDEDYSENNVFITVKYKPDQPGS